VQEYGRDRAVEMFRQRLAEMPQPDRDAYLAPLRDATALCCWCRPGEACHADVLIAELVAEFENKVIA
jgi:hypothetical protein